MTKLANQQRELDELGYCILPDFIDLNWLQELREQVDFLFKLEGDAAGSEFKREPGCDRLANLVNKGDVFRRVVGSPPVVELVGHVLSRQVKLSSLNARRVPARCDVRQPLHCDMSAIPDERGYWVCNTVWMLDDFTPENGAVRVVPGTHLRRQLPQEALEDAKDPQAGELQLTGTAGTVIVMNAHLWHGGTENRTERPRTALHAFYCRRDKPQQQYQKQLLDAELQASLDPNLRELLALDDPRNDQLSAQVETTSGFLK